MIDKFGFLYAISNGLLDIRITRLVQSEAWEQVINQTHEEWFIFVHQLTQIHVAKNSHDDAIFAVLLNQINKT